MAFVGKLFLSIVWVLVSMNVALINGLTETQGWYVAGAGLALIVFWGSIKKVVRDWYEDGRHHRNQRKRLALELHALERRIQAAIAEQQAGHDRTMQLMQFRQQLMQMEAQENDAMIRAMVSTLDSVK